MTKCWRILVLLALALACGRPEPSSPAAPGHAQVAIVGGGIAGLVAAYELERRGVSVTLLEMSDRLGGRIATAHYAPGLFAEYGMAEIWSKSPLAPLARELGVPLDDSEEALSSVVLDGKLYTYSQDTPDAYLHSLFSAQEYAAWQRWVQLAESLFTELSSSGLTPRLAPLNETSFASWLQEQNLPPRVVSFIRLTLECELGSAADEFSALSGLAEFRVFLFGGERAEHVQGGNARVIDALAAKIRGPKLLGARVTAVERSKDEQGRLRAKISFIRDDQVASIDAERVLVAVPWMQLHSIQHDPPLPDEAWRAIDSLGRGQYTVVHFLVDKQIHSLWGGVENQPFPVLTSGPLGVIYGVRPSPAEQPLDVFALLLYGEPAEAFHMQPLERKRQEMLRELERLWPGFSRFVRGAAIYTYHPAAIPYWPVGRSPYDAPAQLLFQDFDGLYLAGDYLVSSHSEGAVRAAQRQAQAIADDLAGAAAPAASAGSKSAGGAELKPGAAAGAAR